MYSYEKEINLRTESNTKKHVAEARKTREKVFGVKGYSVLDNIVYNYVTSLSIDLMHCAFLGVGKKLFTLWFDLSFKNESYSIRKFVKLVDERLLSMKPPKFIQRRPQSIEKDLGNFKASQLKDLILYYSLPILDGILPKKYYEHFELFVSGITLLSKKEVTEQDRIKANQLLHQFVKEYQQLYGVKHMSCNIHCLLHLAEIVKRTGPLWTTSCFPYEDVNGKLKLLVHGSNKAEIQICSNVCMYIQIATLKNEFCDKEDDVSLFINHLLSPAKKLGLKNIGNNISIIGATKKYSGQLPEITLNLNNPNLWYFNKVFFNKFIFTTESYAKNKLENSSFVSFKDDENICFGVIKNFYKITECKHKKLCDCFAKYYVLIQKYNTCRRFENLKNIKQITGPSSLVYTKIINLISVCFYVKINVECSYIIEPINREKV